MKKKYNAKIFFIGMFLLWIVLLVLLSAVKESFSNTYYVSPDGSNTSPYDTPAKASHTWASVQTHGAGGGGPHTVYIAEKTGGYNESFGSSDPDWSNATIIGVVSNGSTVQSAKGDNWFDYTGGMVISLGANVQNWKVHGLSFTGGKSTSNLYDDAYGGTHEWYGCLFNEPVRRFYGSGGTNKAYFCDFLGGGRYTGVPFYFDGATWDFTLCNFDQTMNYWASANGVPLFGAYGNDAINLYSCNVDGNYYCNAENYGTGYIWFHQSIVNNPVGIDDYYTLGSGDIRATDSLLVQPFASSDKLKSGSLTVDERNIKTLQPFFAKRKRQGIIVPCFDDADNYAYVQDLISVFKSRGIHGTWYVEAATAVAGTPWYTYLSDVEEVASDGTFEIGVHSYSHSDVALTGNIYSITKAGATINIDRGNNQIVITAGGTVSGFKTKTLAAIKTELEALGCTVGSLQTNLSGSTLGECMADSGGAQASPYTPQLLIDNTCATGYFKTEVKDAGDLLYAAVGTAASFATPYGTGSEDVYTAVQNAGFLSNRVVWTTTGASRDLSSLDIFACAYFPVATYITYGSPTTEQVKARTRAICENAAKAGSIIFLLAHDATECTPSQWEIILDTIKEYTRNDTTTDIVLCSAGAAADYLSTSGFWSTSDSRTYTRTWTDTTNYRQKRNNLDWPYQWHPALTLGLDLLM